MPLLWNFLVTVKAAPHECVIRIGLPKVKAENEAWFCSKVTVLISSFLHHYLSKDTKQII